MEVGQPTHYWEHLLQVATIALDFSDYKYIGGGTRGAPGARAPPWQGFAF